MSGVPAGLLFAAGAAAAFNPCGVAMLPGYLAFLLGQGTGTDRPRLWSGVWAGLVMTAGFLTVFSVLGLAGTGLGQVLGGWLRWATVLIGVALVVAGIWQGLGRTLPGLGGADRVAGAIGQAGPRRGFVAIYIYGLAYAVASLGCTLPLFLALVAGTASSASTLGGAEAFLAYAGGMGLVATVLSAAAVGSREVLAARLAAWMPVVQRASAVVMGAVGLYLVYYWLLGPGALRVV